jgi:hypothetical protein
VLALLVSAYGIRVSGDNDSPNHPKDQNEQPTTASESKIVTTALQLATPRKRSRFKRILLWGVTALALVLGILVGTSLYLTRRGQARLEQVIAELDRSDPNWRLEDLDRDFAPPPDDQNCTLIIKQILKEKPPNWPAAMVQNKLGNLELQRQLDATQAQLLKHEMDRSPATLVLVRKLAGLKRGYLKIYWPADPIAALLPVVQETREVAGIAKYDAELRAQEKDFDGALESCRAILVAGRASDPVGSLINALVRFAIEAVCIGEIERTLAQGEPSERALAATQSLLEDELAQPLLQNGFRYERGISFRVLENTFKDGNGPSALLVASNLPIDLKNASLNKALAIVLTPFLGSAEANQVKCLETLTDLIQAMNRPESEQKAEFLRMDAMAKDWRQPVLFRLILPSVLKVHEAHLRNQANLRCAVFAIAAERYRRKRGAWPENLDALLTPELKAAGVDPYDGQPLRIRRLPDGLVIYSIGANGQDDGGQVISNTGLPLDTGFRLWDKNQRGLMPPEPAVENPEQ